MTLYKFISNMILEIQDNDYFKNEEKYSILDIRIMILRSLSMISVGGKFIFSTDCNGNIHISRGVQRIVFREDSVEIIRFNNIDDGKYDIHSFKDETEFVLTNGRKFHNTSVFQE